MAISLWELRINLSVKDAASSTEGITRSSVNYLLKRNMNTAKALSLTVPLFALTSFSLLSAFLYFKPFQSNYMNYEMIDRYFNVFLVETQLSKENLKSVFWVPDFGHPNQNTGLPNVLNVSLLVEHYKFCWKNVNFDETFRLDFRKDRPNFYLVYYLDRNSLIH